MTVKATTNPAKGDAAVYIPKRGRPTARQAEAIGDHILRSAQELFLSDGYAQTTMEAVATAAGISKGTLYARYPAKSELFRALVADRLDAWGKLAPGWVEQPGINLFEYLYRRGAALINALKEPEISAFSHLVTSESRQFPELAEDFRTQAYDKLIDEMSAEIDRLCKTGGGATIDSKGVALVFVSAVLGWWQNWPLIGEVSQQDVDHYLARLVALLTGGRAAF